MFSKSKTLLFVTVNMLVFSTLVSADSLNLAIFKTLANNPQIKAEINRKDSRREELRQAESGQYPKVDLIAAVGDENSKNRFTRAAGHTDYVKLKRREEAFVVTYNLFKGFETTSNINKYSAKVRAANHQLHELTEQTALQVAKAYLRVLNTQQLVHLSENSLAMHNQLFKKVKSRSLSGVGRKSDINQAMGRVARAKANLITDQINLQNAKAMYFKLSGEMPSNLTQPENLSNKLPADINNAIELALANNPLIKAANAEIDSANAAKKQATSANYPHLDLVFEQSRGENLDGIEGVENDYSLMLKMRYNIFNGGYDSSRSSQASIQLNESKDKLDNARRNITESMRLAWNAYDSVKMQMPYLSQHVKSITKNRSSYSNQFRIGKRSLLDLLDSESELYQANRALISAKHDQIFGAYKILANMGIFVDQFEAGINKK